MCKVENSRQKFVLTQPHSTNKVENPTLPVRVERRVFGSQTSKSTASTRPEAVCRRSRLAVTQWSAPLRNRTVGERGQFGRSRPWAAAPEQAAMRLLPAVQPLMLVNGRFRHRRRTAPDPQETFVVSAVEVLVFGVEQSYRVATGWELLGLCRIDNRAPSATPVISPAFV